MLGFRIKRGDQFLQRFGLLLLLVVVVVVEKVGVWSDSPI